MILKRSATDLQPLSKKLKEEKSSFEKQLEKLHELSGNVVVEDWEETWKRPQLQKSTLDLCFSF
jgi:predicted transcriptional regulator